MGSVWLDELDEELDELLELLLEFDEELDDELDELDEELLLDELDEELLLDELDEEFLPMFSLSQAVHKQIVVKTDKKMSKNFFISCLQIFAKTALHYFCRLRHVPSFFVLYHIATKKASFFHIYVCAYTSQLHKN